MRTTIEIRDEHRCRLLELAAQRGEKGFSRIVDEALADYFARRAGREEAIRGAMGAIGALPEDSAERLERDVEQLRRSWR